MKKHKIRMNPGILAGCGFCVLAALRAISGTSSYLTDHTEIVNSVTAGRNVTETEEEFPTPTPVAPGEPVIKKVQIRNTGDVPCYIRVSLIVSEGTVTLDGLNEEHWKNGKDGYYYYTDVVEPGSSTEELFTGIRIDGDPEKETVAVTVYEESVQSRDGSEPYKDYQEAWDHYLGGDGV